MAWRADGREVCVFLHPDIMTAAAEDALKASMKASQARGAGVVLLSPDFRAYDTCTDGDIIVQAAVAKK